MILVLVLQLYQLLLGIYKYSQTSKLFMLRIFSYTPEYIFIAIIHLTTRPVSIKRRGGCTSSARQPIVLRLYFSNAEAVA